MVIVKGRLGRMAMAGADRPCRTPELVESVILDQVGEPDSCRFLIHVLPEGCAMGTAAFGPIPVLEVATVSKNDGDVGPKLSSARQVGHYAPERYVVCGLNLIDLHGAQLRGRGNDGAPGYGPTWCRRSDSALRALLHQA